MTTPALVQLAERVMGWTVETLAPDCILANEPDGTPHSITPAIVPAPWAPPTNTTQAEQLLEAWCDLEAGRWYDHERVTKTQHFVYLYLFSANTEDLTFAEATTFAGAATEAVCRAMKIDPGAAE